MYEKCLWLWVEDRTLKQRIFLIGIVRLFFAFTVMLAVPLETFMLNISEFVFSARDTLFALILFTIFLFSCLLIGMIILKGKILDAAISAVFGIGLCFYLQATYFNLKQYSLLDGTEIVWNEQTLLAIINIVIWIIILISIFIIRFFSPNIWKKIICSVSTAVILMQMVAIIFTTVTVDFSNAGVHNIGRTTTAEMFRLSEGKNVVVFLLDGFDNADLANIMSNESNELYDSMGDFTYFTNTTSAHFRTFPSIPYILTGKRYTYDYSHYEYLDSAWEEAVWLQELKANNFDIRLYTWAGYIGNKGKELIDNLEFTYDTVPFIEIGKNMTLVSAFRCVPHAFKPFFVFKSEEINQNIMEHNTNNDTYVLNDESFFQNLQEGIVTQNDKNCFRLYHLEGMRTTHAVDRNGQQTEKFDKTENGMGELKIITDYMNFLKKADIYENTFVIVTADHGNADFVEKLNAPRTPIMLIKPFETNGDGKEKLKVSDVPVAQSDIVPTIMQELGFKYKQYGSSMFDIKQTDNRDRYYLYEEFKDGESEKVIEYKISGNANDFNNWSQTGYTYSTEQYQTGNFK